MRKWIALFMMLFLPLQWSAALAAECCARHDAQTETTVMQHDTHHDHEHHAKAGHQDGKQDGKQAKTDCQMDCVGCHAHHCAAVVIDADALAALPPLHSDDTPYLASITSPAPDNLYRPPLSRLA